jgi:Concanavalin A-like lectin/glucanases superfamily
MSSPPIRINQFGGLSPSLDERNLSPDGAQVARNLDMRFGDFQPSKGLGASVATVAADTRSIFRTPSGVWLSSPTDTDYVNAQINDAASERVYLTGRSAFPEAWQSGTYRQLGVPRPATAPLVAAQVQDEFDQSDATAAQTAATNATVTDLLAADAQAWLGAVVPAAVAPPSVDALYDKVQLHMRFDTIPGGNFVDSSPQQRLLTNSGTVSRGVDTAGPLGASGGTGYGIFGGGHVLVPYIDRKTYEADPTWTVEASIKPTENLEYVVLFARNGGLREITFQRAGQPDVVGNYRTLTSSDFGGAFSAVLRVKRPGGTNAAPANVRTHIAVQNTGARLEVYIDGVFAGATANPEHLEVHNVGRSSWTGTQAFQGSIDELRVTFAARYQTTGFTFPTAPYGALASLTGLLLAHGDGLATSLPTTDVGDAAYAVPMNASGGGFVITSAADLYLADPSLKGSQITYSGAPYWAVPIPDWRASGLALSQATAQTVLGNVVNPASPPAKLLTAPQAAALAPFVFALYDPAGTKVLPLVTALNSAQAALRAQLAATPGSATLAATRVAEVSAATKALEDYFAGMDAELRKVLAANSSLIFGAITSLVVSRLIETRGYIVTYVTDWGEESQPSLPSELLELDQNDAVQVTVPAPPSGRNIVGYRVYRSSTTNNGAAFQLIDAKAASNAVLLAGAFNYLTFANRVYLDTAKQEELQEPCPSLIWAEPPANLKGLVGLPNGIMLGFFGKTLCACVGYYPFAWPTEYQLTLEFNIVGIGVFGQTAVVLTEGHPYYVSGADAASLSAQKIEIPQACIAKRTIAEVEGGVMYASPDGLCLASPNGVQVLTQGAFSRDDWQALVNAEAFGGYSDGSYFLFTDDT